VNKSRWWPVAYLIVLWWTCSIYAEYLSWKFQANYDAEIAGRWHYDNPNPEGKTLARWPSEPKVARWP